MAAQSGRIGWRPYVNVVTQVVNAVDADATAFITAAGITNLTQASAINTLVNDLKTYGLWTKMKALYPMVGGTTTSHKFNLKDPRDLNVAYRLVFNGGWTHTATGALPNGTTAYGETYYTNVTDNSSMWYYSRTNNTTNGVEIGMWNNPYSDTALIAYYGGSSSGYIRALSNGYTGLSWTATTSQGFYGANRTSSTLENSWYNGVKKGTNTNASSQDVIGKSLWIGGYHGNSGLESPSNKETAFAAIGDGLSDTEAANFYNSVQKFQTTLGRQIGSPIVSDTDAQAFINATGLTDLGQANAVNALVVDLKAAGVWTKMKALYPFVGGTATTHKFNLKDPRDLDAAFRLVFSGGWTHTATGALPNGTTGYADTKYNPYLVGLLNSAHISYYSRTNTSASNSLEIGGYSYGNYHHMGIRYTGDILSTSLNSQAIPSLTNNSTQGLFLSSRIGTNITNVFRNDSKIGTNTNPAGTTSGLPTNINLYIGSWNQGGPAALYSNKETAFASIGDGLTDTEASAFYTAVQKFQTTLGRQIGTPVLPSGQTAGLLETYSGAAAAYSLRKLRTGYVGNAIRVRRSSDNAEQDIAFKTNGTLDTVSLLAFVGSGNGFVTTWYDQSCNGLHFAQSTAANQPSIVINGVVVLTLGEPAVRFNSVNKNYLEIPSSTPYFNFLHNGTDSTVISVGRYNFVTDPGTDSTLISNGGAGSGTVGTWVGFSDTSPYNNSFGAYISRGVVGIGDNATHTAVSLVNDTALPYTKQNLHFVNINASAAAIDRIKVQYDNNTIAKNNIRSNTPSTANATNNMMMGMYIQSGVKYSSLEGDVQELIIYNSNQDTNRTGIKNNINSFYSIY